MVLVSFILGPILEVFNFFGISNDKFGELFVFPFGEHFVFPLINFFGAIADRIDILAQQFFLGFGL